MPSINVSLYRIVLEKNALANLPKAHIQFLFMSSHAINEIALFHKILLMSLNTSVKLKKENETLKEYSFIENVILERNLNSKIFEYYNMAVAHDKKITRANLFQASQVTKKIRDFIAQYRADSSYSYAEWLRNKITNHYISNEVMKLIDPGSEYSMLLHEKTGNSKYSLSEELLSRSHFQFSIENHNELSRALLRFSKDVMSIHHLYIISIVKKYFPNATPTPISVSVGEELTGDRLQIYTPLFILS